MKYYEAVLYTSINCYLYENKKWHLDQQFSNVKNCVFCSQIDPESFALGFSARLITLFNTYAVASSIAENGKKTCCVFLSF